ncbi:MAG: hypothetical protein JWR72_2620 [Flavisolibacter sp.]|jgi:hypothetical protein|nr:hypothetical protein [Flavisolibacter sp.]
MFSAEHAATCILCGKKAVKSGKINANNKN